MENLEAKMSAEQCPLRDVKDASTAGIVEQWASRVLGVSSQYDNTGWSAQKILGQPAVYPRYGDIRGAWAQGVCDANQYITIAFDRKLFIQQLNIYETLNAGAVVRIKVRTPAGHWVTLYNQPAVVLTESRIFSPDLEMPSFSVSEIRLDLNCTLAGTWCEIDAVCMIGKQTKTEPPPPLTHLSHDLYTLVNNPESSDVKFSVDGKVVHAHKAILSARSQYFRAMFDSGMKEASCTREAIPMPDVSCAAFTGLLEYLYTNTLTRDITPLTMLELMRAGDRFSAEGLDRLCFWYLNQDLTVDNVVTVYRHAVESLPVLDTVRELCLDFMSENMSSIANSTAFSQLPQPLMLEIVQHSAAKLKI